MSVNLGSASGEIIIRADKAVQGTQAAIRAMTSLESEATSTAAGLKQLDNAGAGLGKGVSAGAKEAESALAAVKTSAAGAGDALQTIGTMATVAGAGLAAGLGLAAKSAAELQSQMALISTIRPDVNVGALGDAVQAMSTRVAQSTGQLAESLYNVFSSVDVSQAEALKLTEQFAQGAVAARTDAETFGTAVLGVMNAYGLAVEDAGHVSDVFFSTINKGVVTGEQLASGLGNVSQAAKNAGVSFDTLGALIAGVTKEGGDAAQNMNNLNNVLQKIVTKDVQDGLQEMGVSTKDASGNFRDIVAVLTDLDGALSKLSAADRAQALQNLFPDAQARTGIQTLLSQLPMITQLADENAKAAGTAADAYQKMGDTAAAQAKILQNTLMTTLQDLGEIALPGLLKTASAAKSVVDAFNAMPQPVKEGAVFVAELATALLLIGGGAIKAGAIILQLASALKVVGTAAVTATQSLLAYAATINIAEVATVAAPALLALAAAFVAVELAGRNASHGIKEAADAIGGDLGKAIASVDISTLDKIKMAFTGIDTAAAEAGQSAKEWASSQPTDVLKTRIQDVAKAYADLVAAGKGSSTAANALRETSTAITEVLLAREKMQAALASGGGPLEFIAGDVSTLDAAAQAAGGYAAALAGVGTTAAGMATGLTSGAGAGSVLGTAILQVSGAADAATASLQAHGDMLAGLQRHYSELAAQAQGVASAVQPMQGAFDLLNQKIAQGIPLTQEQQHLYQTLPGYIAAATSGLDGLVTSQAQAAVAIQNAQAAARPGAFTGLASDAAGLQAALDGLRASAIQLEGAIGALGSENGKLGAEYGILNDRVQALNDKKKESSGLTADEAAELATLQTALDGLGGTMGENAAKQRDLILQLLGVTDTAKTTEGALVAVTDANANMGSRTAEAASGLVGLTDGLGNIAPAADTAATAAAGVTTAVNAIPATKTVEIAVKTTGGVGAEGKFGLPGLTEFGPGDSPTTEATVNVSITDNASPTLKTIQDTLTAMNSLTTDPDVTATDSATAVLTPIQATLTAINNQVTNPNIQATDNASGVAAVVTTNIEAIPTEHSTEASAVDNASGTLQSILELVNSIPKSFSITASVDTSGAMSAIQTLRDNMPSSPAKEGPFRVLPDWNAVYASLEPAGDDAVTTIENTTQQMADALGAGMDEAAQKAAQGVASTASAVAQAVQSTAQALATLQTFRAPGAQQFQKLQEAMGPILQAFVDGARGEEATKAAQEWAAAANTIFGAVSAGADALSKLRTLVLPSQDAVQAFGAASQQLAQLMLQIASDADLKLLAAGQLWAETATALFQAIGGGVDALTKLRDFQRPADKAATDFRDISQFVVNLMAAVAADIEDQALPKARDWADTADAIFRALSSGVDALTKLHDFVRPTDQAVQSFRDVAQYTVNLLAQVAADIEAEALPAATAWADTATAIFGAISTGVDALSRLDEFTRPTDQALQSFADAAQQAVNVIAAVAAQADTELVAAAAVYADAAGKVLQLIGAGSQTLGQLGDQEFLPPTRAQLDQIVEATRQAVLAVSAAAEMTDTDLVDAAATYAEGAGKAVGLIGQGIAAFKDLSSFQPPSAAQIRQIVNVAAETIRRIAEAASTMDQDAVAAAGEFGDAGGRAIGVVGQTLSAFANMKDFVAPSKEGINEVVSVVAYTAQQLAGVARGFDEGTLTQLGLFGENVSSALSAIQGALSVATAFSKEDRPSVAAGLDAALGDFTAGLGPLAALVAVSQTYKTQGELFAQNIAAAYASLGGTLPGFAPSMAAAGAVAPPIPAVITHEFSGSVRFEMMDENGAWIVSSLAIDDVSRDAVADMIADVFAQAAPAA